MEMKCTEKEIYTLYGRFTEGGGREGSKTPTHFSKTMQNVLKPLAKIRKKNRSEIFMLKTLKCYNSTNIARIAFGVVGIDFWAQFTPKIKLWFLILVLSPPWIGQFNSLAFQCSTLTLSLEEPT
jgi:hypothetical protein